MTLPPGFTTRPATIADVEIATDFFSQIAIENCGAAPSTDLDDVRCTWESPEFDLENNVRLVFAADGTLAGYIEVWDSAPYVHVYVWSRVHRDYRGLGIGTHLFHWGEERIRESLHKAPPGARITMIQSTVDTDLGVQQFLEAHGFALTRYYSHMEIEMQTAPATPVLPEGILIRPFDRESEFETVLHTVRDTFRDLWGHVPRPFEEMEKEWRHLLENSPYSDPSLWFVAMDGDEMVGISLGSTIPADPDMGWIDSLGVRRPWRHRGIAQALLLHTFGEYYRRGIHKVALGVDTQSLTGAVRLYEKVGMRAVRRYANYEKELRPGKELGLQSADPE